MKAYAIAAETIKDQAMFDTYRKEVPATLVPFGGQIIVLRGGDSRALAVAQVMDEQIGGFRAPPLELPELA
jgi:uncharacterized protein (DUF1330 family)